MANLVGVGLGSIPGLALKSMKHTQLPLRKEGCSEVEAEACQRDGKRATASEQSLSVTQLFEVPNLQGGIHSRERR